MPRQRRGTASSSSNTATATTDNIPSNSSSSSHGPQQQQELGSMYDYLAKIILLGPSNSGKSCLLHRFVKSEWRILSSQTIGVEFASKIVKVGETTSNGTFRARDSRRKRVKLQLWDTAGTERFRSVSRSYYRGAAGAILVYDVSNAESFRGLGEFLHDARTLGSPQLSVVLVGNKRDLKDDPDLAREVQQQQQESAPDGDACFFGSMSSRTGTIGPSSSSIPKATTTTIHPGNARQRATVATAAQNESSISTTLAAQHWASQHGIPSAVEVSALSGQGVEEAFHKLARIILTKIELGEIDPDDPNSGIQYGDSDYYYNRFDDGSSSIKSHGGLTSDGYGGGTGRRRRNRGVLGFAGGGGGKCC